MHAVIIAQLSIRGHTLDRHEYWRRVGTNTDDASVYDYLVIARYMMILLNPGI